MVKECELKNKIYFIDDPKESAFTLHNSTKNSLTKSPSAIHKKEQYCNKSEHKRNNPISLLRNFSADGKNKKNPKSLSDFFSNSQKTDKEYIYKTDQRDLDNMENNSTYVISNITESSYQKCMKSFGSGNKIKKKIWIDEEDGIIRGWVTINGPKKWRKVAMMIPGRNAKQCRERWHNHLDPFINHDNWTTHEEWILYQV